ncbi:hypothetical protein HGQ17_11940 [Nesterenkonia sp. MY13]|uniref:AEC family transporter n=1 Tax=Nesterenkonia sedimenti TaxID=1463632 RepID=A0A7X8YEJ5_9MICC|nr:AEC family transporter [Nesterenkonia sedimenti]NLS10689.1 hypothetical protein [Nesterenkonia sedimenti]
MGGVVLGFSVVAVLALVGVAIAALARDMSITIQKGITPLVYYVTNPCLMVVVVSTTDVKAVAGLYTPLALAVALLTAACFTIYALLASRKAEDVAVGAMASSYANIGNIGIPVALYVVGNTEPVVAFLLAQLLVQAPMYLTIFGLISRRRASQEPGGSRAKMILASVFNPTTIGVLIGATISLVGITLPTVIWDPLEMIGETSIPLMLLIFGMSLYRQRPFTNRDKLPDSLVATFCKVLVMPGIALLLGGLVFGLQGSDLLGVVAMAALPTAQNVLLFSLHYRMPVIVPQDVIVSTSVLALPVTLLAAWLIAV